MTTFFLYAMTSILAFSCGKHDTGPPDSNPTVNLRPLFLADPTILYDQGIYYLYGTDDINANRGFTVYTSTDLKTWKGPAGVSGGYALKKGDAYGNSGFWAPQVFKYNDVFYMAYVADQHIAIATSDSPLGPFVQQAKTPVTAPVNIIDPYIFIDDDGKKYLYYVRLDKGNRIFAARLNGALTDIMPGTSVSCINAVDQPQAWENTSGASWTVTEGPTVLKHQGYYYLFYSANDFRNIDYAVGYAVSKKPMGPWKKYSGNPILSRTLVGQNGPGHGDFVKDGRGKYYYVFHTHHSSSQVSPRKTALIQGNFIAGGDGGADKMFFDKQHFFYLMAN